MNKGEFIVAAVVAGAAALALAGLVMDTVEGERRRRPATPRDGEPEPAEAAEEARPA